MITAIKGGFEEFNHSREWINRCIKYNEVESIIVHQPGQNDYFIQWHDDQRDAQGIAILIFDDTSQNYILKNVFFDINYSNESSLNDQFIAYAQSTKLFYEDLYLKVFDILNRTKIKLIKQRELILELHEEDINDCLLIGNWRCQPCGTIAPYHHRYMMDMSSTAKKTYLEFLQKVVVPSLHTDSFGRF